MLTKILLLAFISQSMGFKPRNQHHNADDCVDVSKYGPLEYNTTTAEICSYRVERECFPRSQRVCVTLPSTQCTMEAGYTCDTNKWEETVRCDEVQTNTFTPKKCLQNGVKTLREVKKVPECRNVTRQVCDSKWEITAEGEKVFASNENWGAVCRLVSASDCTEVE